MNRKIINYFVAFSIVFGGILSKTHAGFIFVEDAIFLVEEKLVDGPQREEVINSLCRQASQFTMIEKEYVEALIASAQTQPVTTTTVSADNSDSQNTREKEDDDEGFALAWELQEKEFKNNHNNTNDINSCTQKTIVEKPKVKVIKKLPYEILEKEKYGRLCRVIRSHYVKTPDGNVWVWALLPALKDGGWIRVALLGEEIEDAEKVELNVLDDPHLLHLTMYDNQCSHIIMTPDGKKWQWTRGSGWLPQ